MSKELHNKEELENVVGANESFPLIDPEDVDPATPTSDPVKAVQIPPCHGTLGLSHESENFGIKANGTIDHCPGRIGESRA